MDCAKVGQLIRTVRQEKNMTQNQLAELLRVTDKAISKWERGLGLPDISLLPELSAALELDMEKLLEGCLPDGPEQGGNMKKSKFYVCPSCGGISLCTGDAAVSCCGRRLAALEPKKAEPGQRLKAEQVEDAWYITSDHPMTKDSYISFVAFLAGGAATLVKQYPEWNLQARIPRRERGMLIWYSAEQGLLYQLL